MGETKIEKLQVKIREVFRKTMKGRARNLPNDIVHGHKALGGMGIDKLEDLINAHRLKVLEKFLYNTSNSAHEIALGAIHRLQQY